MVVLGGLLRFINPIDGVTHDVHSLLLLLLLLLLSFSAALSTTVPSHRKSKYTATATATRIFLVSNEEGEK